MKWSMSKATSGRPVSYTHLDVYKRQPWYRRDGRQITDGIRGVQEHFDTIRNDCARLDARLAEDARNAAGEGYERLVNAAWRHPFAAHKDVYKRQVVKPSNWMLSSGR